MIEQIYNDFTTRLLPKVAEGLTITKDYFFDFFGRYVKYLIVTDSIALGIYTLCLIAGLFAFKMMWTWEKKKEEEDKYYCGDEKMFLIFPIVVIVIFFLLMIGYGQRLVKDIYIPEVRVFEELKSFNK